VEVWEVAACRLSGSLFGILLDWPLCDVALVLSLTFPLTASLVLTERLLVAPSLALDDPVAAA